MPDAPWPEARSELGEGPCWPDGSSRLYWVDIRAGRVWSARRGETAQPVLELGEPVSALVPVAAGGMLLTGRAAVYHWPGAGDGVTRVTELPGEPAGNRCNEARCDPWGNLWVGTMDDAGRRASGALWCLTRTGELEKALDGLTIPNTLAWDVGRGRMYLGDSAAGALHAFDFDPATRRLGAQRRFLAAGAAPGVPDGSALDREGCLWNARWDGACLARIAPSGAVVAVVELPARRPTSCAFGDGGELFVTTALPDDALQAQPGDGMVWRVPTDTSGLPAAAYAGPTATGTIDVSRAAAPARWQAG